MKKKISLGVWILIAAVLSAGCHSRVDWAVIFTAKGDEYARKGKLDDALAEYNKALLMMPGDHKIRGHFARVYCESQKWNECLENINEYVKFYPDSHAEIYFQRGEAILHSTGNIGESINSGYSEAIARDAKNGRYFYSRGLAYQRLGHSGAAESDFARAHALGFSEVVRPE